MEGVIGVVTWFAGDFVPRNWALCNGAILAINGNQALFSILGNTYGGNGTTNFALPDLQGRYPISAGVIQNRQTYVEGEKLGEPKIQLGVNHLPPHNHDGTTTVAMDVSSSEGIINRAQNTYPAGAPQAYSNSPAAYMAEPAYTAVVAAAGENVPVPLMMPYLVVNYIICLTGIYPSRN